MPAKFPTELGKPRLLDHTRRTLRDSRHYSYRTEQALEVKLKVAARGWADPESVSAVMSDIERDGKRFYAKDNGQASIRFYLDKEAARKLNALTGNALKTSEQ